MDQKALANLLECLVKIPAPSFHENARAAFIAKTCEKMGWETRIDDAGNVLCPLKVNDGKWTVIMAHTDTVFPDSEITVRWDGDILRAPGAGDDAANVAVLLAAMKQWKDENASANKNILFAFNVCEEGLGDLKGVKQIMADLAGQVDEVISLDSGIGGLVNSAVGSKRYRVTVKTPGGHSYGSFGNANAIAAASEIITNLYRQRLPRLINGKPVRTTYNVGLIEGGTSVNTIAQECRFLAEVRSDNDAALHMADETLRGLFMSANKPEKTPKVTKIEFVNQEARVLETETLPTDAPKTAVEVTYELIGDRPSMGDVDPAAHRALIEKAEKVIMEYTGKAPSYHSSSTDCNIPLSMGIPAICFGGYIGGGAHTREEWVDTASLPLGLKIVSAFLALYRN